MERLRTKWKIITMLLILLLLQTQYCSARGFPDVTIFNEDEARSRLLMLDGHMYFHAGKSKNITFIAGAGGSIFLGDKDLSLIAELVEFRNLQTDFGHVQAQVINLAETTGHVQEKVNDVVPDISEIKKKVIELSAKINALTSRKGGDAKGRRLRRILGSIRDHLMRLESHLNKNECTTSPCQNGGTCIDLYNKFTCLCLFPYQGPTCADRIDQCELYKGTHAGCQNNATCIDSALGIRCVCPKGFHGTRCQTKRSACDLEMDLCGTAGHCIPAPQGEDSSVVSGKANYKCLCDWGYRLSNDEDNPTCEDIDECKENPCYPGASCINLPGTFRCSGCPSGMTGNGLNCVDIDECALPQSTECSKDPPVQCINTLGSYLCGPCPPGYTGDGRVCKKTDSCADDPCYPGAKCYNMDHDGMSIGEFRCECPAGMVGSGIGAEGCFLSETAVCSAETCLNQGSCQPLSATKFVCHCLWGYAGERCELETACLKNICGSRGQCIPHSDGSYACICSAGYYGRICQYEEDECGGHLFNSTGSIQYPDPMWSVFGRNNTCEWFINTDDPNKVIELNFTHFNLDAHLPEKVKCNDARSRLTLRDGASSLSPILGIYCGDQTSENAPRREPIRLSSNEAYLLFESKGHHTVDGGFTVKWTVVERKCGGQRYDNKIHGNEGEVVLYDYGRQENCVWQISVDPGMHIEINILSHTFDSGDVSNCSVNSLEIFDGVARTEENRLGRSCSSESSVVTVRTTVRYSTVYFRSNIAGNVRRPECTQGYLCRRGFKLTFKSIKVDDCGGALMPDEKGVFSGTIQSPNFGFSYPPNLNCNWLLDASGTVKATSDEHVVKVELLDVDIPSSPVRRIEDIAAFRGTHSPSLFPLSPFRRLMQFMGPCRYDYLLIRDGGDITDPAIGRFCNERKPDGPIVSSGPKMLIQFHSNQSISGRGFKLKYESTCEKHFTAMNGTIQSSNYPNGSARPFKCTYVIDARKRNAIRIVFQHIELNSRAPFMFLSQLDPAHSDDYIELSGGHSSHEFINKRYYGLRYPFIAPGRELVTSGSTPFKIIYSSSNAANKGFSLKYEQFDVGCGGVFYGETGRITSPNFPEKYLPQMYCIYVITVKSDERVRLTFDVFELEIVPNREGCPYDRVEVFESYVSDEEHGHLHGRYCGSLPPPSIMSFSNHLSVVFKSDRSFSGVGFSASWQAVNVEEFCHRTFTAPSGFINITISENQRFTQCDYQIALPSNRRILLVFHNISSPCHVATLSVMNGIDERSPQFSGLWRNSEVCDDHKVSELRSQGNHIFMRLKIGSFQKITFNISYEQILSGCGGRVSGLHGALSAPQYPLKDSRTLSCVWHIVVAFGNHIRFQIANIDDLGSADGNGFCSDFAPNFIDVADGPSPSARILRRYCQKEMITSSIESSSNELSVRYKQHGGTHFGALFGFLAHYSTVCQGITLRSHHGVLQSPGYPDEVNESRFCKWKIQSSRGNRIRLTFHRFRISETYSSYVPACFTNYLEIGEKQIRNVTLAGNSDEGLTEQKGAHKFCDRSGAPMTILSERNEIDITFTSKNEPDNHFWLSWSTVGCGGIINTETNYDVSLKNLMADADIYECEWTVKAPIGLRILFFVEKMSIFNDGTPCSDGSGDNFSGLAFYSGSSNKSDMAQKVICDSVSDAQFRSHTNELYVRFIIRQSWAKADRNGSLLRGKIRFVNAADGDECGAQIGVPIGRTVRLHSPNYPAPYPRSVKCIWFIIAPPGHSLNFNITEFNALNYHPQKQELKIWRPFRDSNITCQGPISFVEGSLTFYDGNTTDGELLERFCRGMKKPKNLPTVSSEVLVVFHGAPYDRSYMTGDDDTKHRIGFAMEITLRCGGTLIATEESQSFRVDSFDSDTCTFRFKSSNSEQVYVRIDHFKYSTKLQNFRGKSPATITVVDGPPDGQVLGVFHSQCDPVDMEHQHRMCPDQEFRSSGDQLTLMLDGLATDHLDYISVTYSNQKSTCGGTVMGVEGILRFPFISGEFECVWMIENTPGNGVKLEILELVLPASEYCSASYLEIRDSNSTGEILLRACSDVEVRTSYTGRSFWIRLHYSPPDENDDTELNEEVQNVFYLQYTKIFGTGVSSYVISSPSPDDWRAINYRPIEWQVVANENHWLRFTIDQIEIPKEANDDTEISYRDYSSGLIFNEGFCRHGESLGGCGPIVRIISGFEPPNPFFIRSQMATILFNAPPRSSFSLHWEEMEIQTANTSIYKPESKEKASEYNCGEVLAASWEKQYLTNPGALDENNTFTTVQPTTQSWRFRFWNRRQEGYAHNLKCRWTITGPKFTSLHIRILSMDLEEHVDCRLDFVGIQNVPIRSRSSEDDSIGYMDRYCRHSDVGRELKYGFDNFIYVYFITDRNRAGRGFVLEYQLECNAFEYHPAVNGLFNEILTSPNYPQNYAPNLSCYWTIALESNRNIKVAILDLDIEDSENCEKDSLTVVDGSVYAAVRNESQSGICGTKRDHNFTLGRSPIVITFVTDEFTSGKGFSLRLTEVVHDCSSDRLILNEGDLPKMLTSPGFPGLSPNSLDCQWTITAPSGHRIKFTVDPRTFDLQNSSPKQTCTDDYLEIHDGPSVHSPLIGRYCEIAPGSVYSTGSYLFVKYVTDSWVQSIGWNATFEIASCGGTVVIPVNGSSFVRTPHYPDPYPNQIDCNWTVMAPPGHYVNATFNHLWMSFSENCSVDNVTLWENGSILLSPACTTNVVTGKHFTTSRNLMMVRFQSSNALGRTNRMFCSNRKCGFELRIEASKLTCGGEITDSRGRLTTPGYPDELSTHIACEWFFRAGPGHRYVFLFSFIKSHNFYREFPDGNGCFPDVRIRNGVGEQHDYYDMNNIKFCRNKTRFISSADLVTVTYDDKFSQMTRNNLLYFHRADNLYAPFHIDYFKVPSDYDENGCTYLLSSNDTLSIDKPPKAYDPNFNPGEFCHIRLERPIAGTSLLRFTNVSLNTDSFWDNQGRCYDMDTFIEISSSIDQPWPFATRFCNSTLRNATNFSVAVTHEKFDIFVYQQANDQVKFNLTVQFLPCGGYYNGPDGGFIASPGYNNGSYPANTQCIWSFKAPEAKVVKLKIVDMNLEHSYECKHDYLRVYEGGGTDASLIHIYCNNDQMEPLQERFQDVKSKGRYLTLYFVSDGTIQMKGFKIEYSFIGFDDECGFSTNSLNGTILSPGSPKDYPNGASCLWDISVPHGYHIALMFNRFDVQKSDKCAKDSVKISQEHQTRAVEPHGQYYFLFDHEEEAKIYCGYENPESYHSESPRIKIRFVSDERITGKGFNITWKAECGGIYRLNHGVITSPHYPSFYPNIDSRCDYLIDPEYEGVPIIVLKIQDFDLDGANVAFDRRPCQSDYLEIRDVFQSRVVNTLCVGRNDKGEFPPISIKGPVGIRFQSNTSFFYGEPKRKPFRGFKISYALSKCGGEINLKNADSGMSEKISSPGFPLPYHHDLKCIWNISAPSERIINVKYLDFDLEDASGCHFDYLELFDGAEISNVTSMGRLCGSRVPPNQVSSSSNWMIIKFVSDRSLSKGGFKLVVTATVGPKQGCGGNLTAEGNWKELKAPIDQDTGTYYNYLRCGWVIKAPPKKIIQIQITEFELEEPVMQSWGCFDYLSIYDGYKTISPFLMSNTCKITEELPLSMYSSYRVVFVYFESDSGTARKGFNLEYRAIDAFCGGNYIAESYRKELSYESEKMLTRTSPKRQRCRFIIYSTQKMPIRVEFSRFSFPSDTVHCQDEYMEIRDAGSPTECHHPACTSGREFLKTIRVCGSSRPADFISGTSIVQITTSAILQSEHTSKFDLKYQILSDCNRTIDVYEKMTGRITSPNYPNPYDHNSSCTTVLQAIEGYRIFLVFKEFRLERARRRPGVRPMSLRDVVNLRRGISIVENIISRYGNLPWKEECEYDYVQIMNTGSNDAKRYCDFKIPPPQLSTNNTLIIYFKSDGTMAPIGYDAYYYVSKPAKSGSAVYYDFGTIGEFQGAIENIGFPGYPPATRMRWRIEPPNGHKCTLSFMKMDFGIYENGQCVNGDHMVMAEYNHKDPLENSPLLYLPCRNATTYPHRVTLLPGTNVLLEFFTDDDQSNDGEGFRLQWECENYYVPQA